MIVYELWETRSGNLISSFESESAALASVARSVHSLGPGSVATVALVRLDDEDDDAEIVQVAAGDDLLARIGQPA